MRPLLCILYAPVFFFGLIGLATWLVGYRELSPAWLPAMLLGAILVSYLAERLLPYQPSWNQAHADGPGDLLHALVNESLNIASLAIIPLLAGLWPAPPLWPAHWPLWLQLLVAIGVADFGVTLMHWLSHRSALLWRLHAVHHSVPRLYGFNGLMKHPLHQMLEAGAGVLPLILLGLPLDVAALLAFAVAVQLLCSTATSTCASVRCATCSPGHHYTASTTSATGAPATSTSRCSSVSGIACWAPPSIGRTTG